MTITYDKVQDLSATISLKFDEGLKSRTPVYKSVTENIPSNGESNVYPIGEIPGIREFLGERVLNEIKEYKQIIVNRVWEGAIRVPRPAVEDDNYGFYGKQSEKLGIKAAEHPDRLLAEVIIAGFTDNGKGYDGVSFFNAAHPNGPNNTTQSNLMDGDGEPWILIDSINGMAFVYQERIPVKLEQPDFLSEMTFMRNIYAYGTYGRYAIGTALWQSALGSKAPLTADNYAKAVEMMAMLRKEEGEYLAIVPTHIIVGPKNKAAANKLFKGMLINGGDSNTNYEAVEIVYLPYLASDSTPASGGDTKTVKSVRQSQPQPQTQTITVDEVISDNGNTKTVRVGDVTFDVANNQLRSDYTLTLGGVDKYNEAKETKGN